MSLTLALADEDATLDFGRRLAKACQAGPNGELIEAVIYLEGNLGAGKTTLSRGFMRGLGHGGTVKSPTYTLVEPYEFRSGQVYHFDLYRLVDPEEFAYLGVEGYFGPRSVCLIEWPERGQGLIPGPDLILRFSGIGTGRQLRCQSESEVGEYLIQTISK